MKDELYDKLQNFLRDEMFPKMQAIYQPILIRTLLESQNGSASIQQVAQEICIEDNQKHSLKDYENTIRNMRWPNCVAQPNETQWRPVKSLNEHDVYELQVNFEKYTHDEVRVLVNHCNTALQSYLKGTYMPLNDTRYYRIWLGESSVHAQECFSDGFIGVDYSIHHDLSDKLTDRWQDFNEAYREVWLDSHPSGTKIGAGLSCRFLWTVTKGITESDFILCPDGQGKYRVGKVTGDYYYSEGQNLPHRRPVSWLDVVLSRDSMSTQLQNSARSIGTVSNITKHQLEIEKLIHASDVLPDSESPNDDTEDPTVFALEKHLEEFLIHNWSRTTLGREYDIYSEEGISGQQFPTDTGPIDILAISKDKRTLLVIELKKGRASDSVVGQIQRYMGYIHLEMKEQNQVVKGLIIAFEDDLRIRRALAMNDNIEFCTYSVSFELNKM